MDLLKLKVEMKKRKPVFVRQESHRKKLSRDSWRRPKGRHTKMGERRADRKAVVKVGYKMPREIRGLEKSGLQQVNVSNLSQLEKISKSQIAVLSSALGQRKKLILLKKAQDLDITVAGIKDIKKYITEIEDAVKKRKEDKKKKLEEKKAKEKKRVGKKEEKKKEEKKPTEEIKPKEEKKPEAKMKPEILVPSKAGSSAEQHKTKTHEDKF